MARKTRQKTAGPDVRVKMVAPHSYKLDARSKRHLPKGWSGLVPEAIADEIEVARTGARDEPFEIVDSKDTGMRAAKGGKAAERKGAGDATGADGATGGAASTTTPATSTTTPAATATDAGTGAAPATGDDTVAGQDGSTDLLGQGGTGGD
ncbi:hypothetical protein GCM10011415_28120 [Salipiger pallidus]|uniref:Uncharacterized protein n=1 Tax=Salipiger pallidus TaxID=1775170 RepID=A0A8J2ZL10_9RHOB|nr:hypothetical protein [Salipiger pallidus]GGG77582.1 hypothetical protein GCM10011415_28120 [Salipiger pallidus]